MGDWQKVPVRKRLGRQKTIGDSKELGDTTKFYISNFPPGCNPWEVSEFFGGFGEVVGSYIARKRDKDGNRFGFVTFKKVRNVVDLEKSMNGVKMGHCRLRVNVARFAMENMGLWEVEENKGRNNVKQASRAGRKEEDEVTARRNEGIKQPLNQGTGVSFVAALKGKASGFEGDRPVSTCKSIKIPDNVVAFHDIRGRSLIGRVMDLKTLTCMKNYLEESGFGGFEIVYVGGLSLLMKFQDKDEALGFLSKKEVWSKWFKVLDVWIGQALSFERVAWLKIHGVPINLATNETFDDIASLFGKVIHPSQLCLGDGDISEGLVGILVGEGGKISDTVNLRWSNKTFRTWIIEDSGKWDPECSGAVIMKKEIVVEPLVKSCDVGETDVLHVPGKGGDKGEDEEMDHSLEEGEYRIPLHGEFVETQTVHGKSQEKDYNDVVFENDVDVGNEYVGCSASNYVEVAEINHVENSSSLGLNNESNFCNLFGVKKNIGLRPKVKTGRKIKRSQKPKNNTISPMETNRPKKRCRQEEDDPFDLDRFIGIVYSNEKSGGEEGNGTQGGETLVGSREDVSDPGKKVDEYLDKEVENTI
ncbi:nucleotide-binding alpha-beta plait domain-containing protein [Artemisia annua]|uniref:Nucleotide-binding alpha-beta plait domain-containing protein n=1 Tax=Artemisia annua TaxID=35608 RepID=A0A2U1P322_ARTAN|nr:nucleotide-binding alpha-beta plait domain-containing protein [Artemisia annua]